MELTKDHYISVKNGVFDSTSKQDLDHLFTSLAAHPNRDTIVVYLHGGLTSEQGARKTAEDTLYQLYADAGAYPIFFFWQTGLSDVLTGNLTEIFDEKVFKRLLMRVVQFVVAKLGQTVDTRGELLELPSAHDVQQELARTDETEPYAPWRSEHMPADAELLAAEEAQFQAVLEGDAILTNEAQGIANGLLPAEDVAAQLQERGGTIQGSTETLMSPSVLQDIREEATTDDARGIITTTRLIKAAVSVLKNVIQRFAAGRDHGVFTTVVEELLYELYLANVGQMGWRLMKDDSADAFKPDAEIHGGTAFLEGLKDLWEKDLWEPGHGPRILLVGHSAGSVFICNLLQAAQDLLPPEIQFDVIFLAPGCNFDLFAETLDKAEGRIGNIRLFTMTDEGEQGNHMLGPLFPRSILYFVSGLLEDERDKPLVGMERFFDPSPPFDPDSYPQVERGRAFFNEVPERTVWSIENSGPGRASTAVGHGGFDDEDAATMNSVKHIISVGF